MKYAGKFATEISVCEMQRARCVCEVAGVEPGSAEASSVSLLPGTPEFVAFLAKFNEFLEGESDLGVVGVGMDALIDALDAEAGNVLSEQDLALLEPFFAEKVTPSLSLVKDDPQASA